MLILLVHDPNLVCRDLEARILLPPFQEEYEEVGAYSNGDDKAVG